MKKFFLNENQLAHLSTEVSRVHILNTLDEIEIWLRSGKTIDQYILIKRHLFTVSNN